MLFPNSTTLLKASRGSGNFVNRCRCYSRSAFHFSTPSPVSTSFSISSSTSISSSKLSHFSLRSYTKKKDDIEITSDVKKPSDLNKQEYMRYITIKTIADIPPKYHKKINEQIPNTLKGYQLVDRKDMKDLTLKDAQKFAAELQMDLVLVNETEDGVGLLKIFDYQKEMEKVLSRLQDNEIDALIRKKINDNKGKARDVLETLNLRIDKGGAEMKANLAKKLFLKGKFVMFDIHVGTMEEIDLAMQKLSYVKDFIEQEFPDIAYVSCDIEAFKKRVFVEFAPSEALFQQRKEAEQARKAAAAEKDRNKRKGSKQNAGTSTAVKPKRRKDDTDPYKGKRFQVEDF